MKISKNLKINDEDIKKYTLIAICNGRFYGGGFKIAPEAIINDGEFDVYQADEISKLRIPFLIDKLKKGTHISLKEVSHQKSNHIQISSLNEVVCNYDGEVLLSKNFDITLDEKQITIFNDKELVRKLIKK